MPLATSYSEATLADFMVAELGATGVALGLTDASAGITNAVLATARLLGDDIADLSNMALLEAAARMEAWKAAEAAALAEPNKLKSEGDELDFSQRLEGLRTRMARAEGDYASALAAAGGSSAFAFAVIQGCRGR